MFALRSGLVTLSFLLKLYNGRKFVGNSEKCGEDVKAGLTRRRFVCRTARCIPRRRCQALTLNFYQRRYEESGRGGAEW